MNMTEEIKTFRGRTLEDVLPKIKAELGPDAVIVRQRDGLTGGVGGFFQRACIEVDAHAPEPEPSVEEQPRRRFDAYDDEPAVPEPLAPEPRPDFVADVPTSEGLTAPGIQEILRQAAPFADHLSAASEQVERAPEPKQVEGPPEPKPVQRAPEPQPVAAKPSPPASGALENALASAGIDATLAHELVAETVSHRLPFATPRALKKLVRAALAQRIPVARPGARSLAFVGPGGSGKTLCTARLATAYSKGSDLPVIVIALRQPDGGAELTALLEPLGIGVTAVDTAEAARAHIAGALGHALVLVDTPAVSPRNAADVAALGAELDALGLDEVHLTLPATHSGPAAEELVERLAPLAPARIALTHMDETTHVGGLVDYLIRSGKQLSYVSAAAIEPADPDALAALVLP